MIGRFVRATAAMTIAAAALAGPVHADMASVSPVVPATGFPYSFTDTNGLELELCVDAPFCLTALDDLKAPDGEAFWWSAEADVTLPGGGSALLVMAQEAAFLDNEPIAFGRVRVRLRDAQPSTTYHVEHPFGSLDVTTDDRGGGTVTDDRGCTDAAPGAACDWAQAVAPTGVGPYLTWDPIADAPPGFVGNPNVPHTVTGSPREVPFNAFSVSGPGGTATTDEFLVEGKIAGDPPPMFTAAPVSFGVQTVGASATRTVTITNNGAPHGTTPLAISQITLAPGDDNASFAVGASTCTAPLRSGESCTVPVTFTPASAGAKSARLRVSDNTTAGSHTVVLAGSGSAPAPGPSPGGGGTPSPAPPVTVTQTIVQTVPGAGAVAGQGVAGATQRALRVSRLSLSRRISRARLRARGLRASMRVAQGTNVVRIAVYRARNGRRQGRALLITNRVPRSAGVFRVVLRDRRVRALRPGRYVMEVRSGQSRATLGPVVRRAFQVTR